MSLRPTAWYGAFFSTRGHGCTRARLQGGIDRSGQGRGASTLEHAGARVVVTGGGCYAQRIQSQAGTAIRAHQGQREAARREHQPGGGDRGADGEQGARPLGRGEDGEPHVGPGHVLVPARWAALAPGRPGPDVCPALLRGAQPWHQGPFVHVQGAACAGTWPLTLGTTRVLLVAAALPGRKA